MKTFAAVAIATAMIVSIGPAAAPASAQETTQQKLKRQQRTIEEQEQLIQEYRRQLASKQQPAREEGGFLFGCPRGYTWSYVGGGCLPDLPAQVVVVPHR